MAKSMAYLRLAPDLGPTLSPSKLIISLAISTYSSRVTSLTP